MRTITESQVKWAGGVWKHSELKKPYLADNYEDMERMFTPAQARFNISPYSIGGLSVGQSGVYPDFEGQNECLCRNLFVFPKKSIIKAGESVEIWAGIGLKGKLDKINLKTGDIETVSHFKWRIKRGSNWYNGGTGNIDFSQTVCYDSFLQSLTTSRLQQKIWHKCPNAWDGDCITLKTSHDDLNNIANQNPNTISNCQMQIVIEVEDYSSPPCIGETTIIVEMRSDICCGSLTITDSDGTPATDTITNAFPTNPYAVTGCCGEVQWTVDATGGSQLGGSTISSSGVLSKGATACGTLVVTAICECCNTTTTQDVRVTDSGHWHSLGSITCATGAWADHYIVICLNGRYKSEYHYDCEWPPCPSTTGNCYGEGTYSSTTVSLNTCPPAPFTCSPSCVLTPSGQVQHCFRQDRFEWHCA